MLLLRHPDDHRHRVVEPLSSAPAPTWNRGRTGLFARASFAVVPVWMGLAMLTHDRGPAWLHAVFDLPFTLLCHRRPERVLSILGTPMPVCSRCAGLWLGLTIAALLAWPALPLKVLRVLLPVAAALMLAEVVTQDLGWHPVFHPTRLLSGLLVAVPLGGAIGKLITTELGSARSGPEAAAAPAAGSPRS